MNVQEYYLLFLERVAKFNNFNIAEIIVNFHLNYYIFCSQSTAKADWNPAL